MEIPEVNALLAKRVGPRCKEACTFLTEVLQVPPALSSIPISLKTFVDGNQYIILEYDGDSLVARTLDVLEPAPHKYDQPACYVPGIPALSVSTECLDEEAKSAELPEEPFLEILLAHESLHAVMMSKFYGTPTGSAGWRWRYDGTYTHIHEALAMRFCESLDKSDVHRIDRKHIDTYLAFVRRLAYKRPAGAAYKPYFETYANVGNAELWHELAPRDLVGALIAPDA